MPLLDMIPIHVALLLTLIKLELGFTHVETAKQK